MTPGIRHQQDWFGPCSHQTPHTTSRATKPRAAKPRATKPFDFKWGGLRLVGWKLVGAVVLLVGLLPGAALGCPFCKSTQATLREELEGSLFAFLAVQLEQPTGQLEQPTGQQPDKNEAEARETSSQRLFGRALTRPKFRVTKWLKGQNLFQGSDQAIEVLYYGNQPAQTGFLIYGRDARVFDEDPTKVGRPQPTDPKAPRDLLKPEDIAWSVPIALTETSKAYVIGLTQLADDPLKRLAFFQDYFEHPEEILAADAYNEVALTDYEFIRKFKPQMQRKKYIRWIEDPQVSPSHRRQYLTLLGVCGTQEEVPLLEKLIKSTETVETARTSLDALIACYLMLAGENGLELIENRFLGNPEAEYGDTYSAITALRFHAQLANVIPKQRLAESLRLILQRKKLADLVIPDLARLEDWSVVDELTKLFKDTEQEITWIRVPIIRYLKACPLPEAQERLAELKKLDPKTYRKAMIFGMIGRRPGGSAGNNSDEDSSSSTTPSGDRKSVFDPQQSPNQGPSSQQDTGPEATGPEATGPEATGPEATGLEETKTSRGDPGLASQLVQTQGRTSQDMAGEVIAGQGLASEAGSLNLLRNVRNALDWKLGVMIAGVIGLTIFRFAYRSQLDHQTDHPGSSLSASNRLPSGRT